MERSEIRGLANGYTAPHCASLHAGYRGPSVQTYVSAALSTALTLAAWLLTPATASAYTVYITNEKDNTVSIIDSGKLEVIKTIKVGQRPRGITLSKDHRW